MSLFYRFFASLSSYIPPSLLWFSSYCLCTAILHSLPSCFLFFSSVLCIYFVHIPHYSEFLFEVLTCPFSCCLKGHHSLPSTVWGKERLETPKRQEECLQNTLVYLCLAQSLLNFGADGDCSVPQAHRNSERQHTWGVQRMELLRSSSLDQAWSSSRGIFLRPIVKPSGGSG